MTYSSLNKNRITYNTYNDVFNYEWTFINCTDGMPCFIQLRDLNFRHKRDIKEFLYNGGVVTIDSFIEFIAKYDMGLKLFDVIMDSSKKQCNAKLFIMARGVKNATKIQVIDTADAIDNKFSDLD